MPLQDKGKGSNTTLQVTGAVGWRSEGIKHKKNDVFLDIIEQVNLLVSTKGNTGETTETDWFMGNQVMNSPEWDRPMCLFLSILCRALFVRWSHHSKIGLHEQ